MSTTWKPDPVKLQTVMTAEELNNLNVLLVLARAFFGMLSENDDLKDLGVSDDDYQKAEAWGKAVVEA